MSSEERQKNSDDLYSLSIDGLMRSSDYEVEQPEYVSITLELPGEALVSEIWSKVEGESTLRCLHNSQRNAYCQTTESGFVTPIDFRYREGHFLYRESRKQFVHQPTEVEVVAADVPSNYEEKRINVNDAFVFFTNLPYRAEASTKVKLSSGASNPGTWGADKAVINGSLEISFQRTLRMPDDKRLHQLPASLGQFPLFNVEEYAERLPPDIANAGGLFFPMWQREAMWIGFTVRNYNPQKRYALRIYLGRINAVSGLSMDEKPPAINEKETKQDYVVIPQQKWIDGICVAPGVVRQFVAVPCK